MKALWQKLFRYFYNMHIVYKRHELKIKTKTGIAINLPRNIEDLHSLYHVLKAHKIGRIWVVQFCEQNELNRKQNDGKFQLDIAKERIKQPYIYSNKIFS